MKEKELKLILNFLVNTVRDLDPHMSQTYGEDCTCVDCEKLSECQDILWKVI